MVKCSLYRCSPHLGAAALTLNANHDLAARWDRFLSEPFDAERLFVISWHDGIDRDVPAGIVLNQVLHHGNEHRTQINTTLTSIGVQTPDLGLWDFAEATNRALQRTAV